jgi:hypothetical protein
MNAVAETPVTPAITGYRNLSKAELATINRIKALAEEVGALCNSLDGPVSGIDGEGAFFPDGRWRSIAQTQLQQGFMALTRAVAQPTTF